MNLADYKVGEEKIAVLHNSIDHLEIAKTINLDFLNCYFLTLAYNVLGDELEGSEMIQAKRKAEEYSRQTIQFEEGKNDGDAYCDLGNIVCDLADEDEVFHRKMERRHEGIGYL